MTDIKTVKNRVYIASGTYVLRTRTLIAAILGIGLAQLALAIPASLNGLFQHAVGQFIGVLTPGASLPTRTRLLVLWTGESIAGIGAAALFPTTLAMLSARTHNPRDRVGAVAMWPELLAVAPGPGAVE